VPGSLTVVINAAGIGSRLDYGLPKCLVPILGRPLLDWQLDLLGDVEVVVVAGFRAAEVAEHLGRARPDVPVILNHRFRYTGTAASLRLGAAIAQESVVSLDGDLLVDPDYMREWLADGGPLVGVTPKITTEAVGVDIDETGHARAMGFGVASDMEWNGLLRLPRDEILDFGDGHVFESLLPRLPIRVAAGDCVEIDHPRDLDRAATWLSARVDETRSSWTS
jgi:choline kinase